MNRDSHGRNLWRPMPRAESAGGPRQFGQTGAGSREIGHHDAASASTHMSSANLPQFMWGDPADAYERIESATCRGCEWIIPLHVAG